MGKGLSLWFASSSIVLMAAASIMLSHNIWAALGLGVLTILNIGWGFIVKARLRRSGKE
ncbi:hypothetical protein JJQ72_07880 [Paenibacillus sp. F411]|uniref:Uncharacterized protein n=1 Tax=Paenibacillus algicola TaxID=2565926 RepID=A0A4P8XMZ5_9BACL|nr:MULTISPECIES: hypothetical protein [Paenibacillus]MBO2943894.1 hypothetical protein [Paenibacillus sp. F411]QCT04192.1 hypothetical protein E6C60_3481 [Paenibacillus algicola]